MSVLHLEQFSPDGDQAPVVSALEVIGDTNIETLRDPEAAVVVDGNARGLIDSEQMWQYLKSSVSEQAYEYLTTLNNRFPGYSLRVGAMVSLTNHPRGKDEPVYNAFLLTRPQVPNQPDEAVLVTLDGSYFNLRDGSMTQLFNVCHESGPTMNEVAVGGSKYQPLITLEQFKDNTYALRVGSLSPRERFAAWLRGGFAPVTIRSKASGQPEWERFWREVVFKGVVDDLLQGSLSIGGRMHEDEPEAQPAQPVVAK